jgi:hypothetical protein
MQPFVYHPAGAGTMTDIIDLTTREFGNHMGFAIQALKVHISHYSHSIMNQAGYSEYSKSLRKQASERATQEDRELLSLMHSGFWSEGDMSAEERDKLLSSRRWAHHPPSFHRAQYMHNMQVALLLGSSPHPDGNGPVCEFFGSNALAYISERAALKHTLDVCGRDFYDLQVQLLKMPTHNIHLTSPERIRDTKQFIQNYHARNVLAHGRNPTSSLTVGTAMQGMGVPRGVMEFAADGILLGAGAVNAAYSSYVGWKAFGVGMYALQITMPVFALTPMGQLTTAVIAVGWGASTFVYTQKNVVDGFRGTLNHHLLNGVSSTDNARGQSIIKQASTLPREAQEKLLVTLRDDYNDRQIDYNYALPARSSSDSSYVLSGTSIPPISRTASAVESPAATANTSLVADATSGALDVMKGFFDTVHSLAHIHQNQAASRGASGNLTERFMYQERTGMSGADVDLSTLESFMVTYGASEVTPQEAAAFQELVRRTIVNTTVSNPKVSSDLEQVETQARKDMFQNQTTVSRLAHALAGDESVRSQLPEMTANEFSTIGYAFVEFVGGFLYDISVLFWPGFDPVEKRVADFMSSFKERVTKLFSTVWPRPLFKLLVAFVVSFFVMAFAGSVLVTGCISRCANRDVRKMIKLLVEERKETNKRLETLGIQIDSFQETAKTDATRLEGSVRELAASVSQTSQQISELRAITVRVDTPVESQANGTTLPPPSNAADEEKKQAPSPDPTSVPRVGQAAPNPQSAPPLTWLKQKQEYATASLAIAKNLLWPITREQACATNVMHRTGPFSNPTGWNHRLQARARALFSSHPSVLRDTAQADGVVTASSSIYQEAFRFGTYYVCLLTDPVASKSPAMKKAAKKMKDRIYANVSARTRKIKREDEVFADPENPSAKDLADRQSKLELPRPTRISSRPGLSESYINDEQVHRVLQTQKELAKLTVRDLIKVDIPTSLPASPLDMIRKAHSTPGERVDSRGSRHPRFFHRRHTRFSHAYRDTLAMQIRVALLGV